LKSLLKCFDGIGIKKLDVFNDTLLAKQLYGLSLILGRVLQKKYFPKQDFS